MPNLRIAPQPWSSRMLQTNTRWPANGTSLRVERWARQPIEIGPAHARTPHVLGPNALPRLDPAEVKRSPVLATLSSKRSADRVDDMGGALT